MASPDPRGWGAEVRGSGGRSGVQGQSPGEGLGAKLPEADAYTQIYIYTNLYIHTHTHIRLLNKSCEKSLFSLQFTEFDQPGLGSLSRCSLRQTDSVAP